MQQCLSNPNTAPVVVNPVRQVFMPERGKKYELCIPIEVILQINGAYHIKWNGAGYIPNPEYIKRIQMMGLPTPNQDSKVALPKGVILTIRTMDNRRRIGFSISKANNKQLNDIVGKFDVFSENWHTLFLREI